MVILYFSTHAEHAVWYGMLNVSERGPLLLNGKPMLPKSNPPLLPGEPPLFHIHVSCPKVKLYTDCRAWDFVGLLRLLA